VATTERDGRITAVHRGCGCRQRQTHADDPARRGFRKEHGLDGKKLAYSVEEACQALGIGRALTYELIMSGRLHSIKVGARRLIPSSALAEFLGGAA
jgi:excisionase family DNA binding protein